MAVIRNPIEWSADQLTNVSRHVVSISKTVAGGERENLSKLPTVNRITIDDLREALRAGFEDFKACRSDVLGLSLIYPIAGLALWWIASNQNLLPLLFPLASGFALLGPAAAVGTYEMSRQRELGRTATWADAFAVLGSPAFGSIVVLALLLLAIFFLWLVAAQATMSRSLGQNPRHPSTLF